MGNRMDAMKSVKPASVPHPKNVQSPFIPILPFSTPSNLGALYNLGPELGRGQFGTIRSCTSRSSGTLFACKSISKVTCSVDDIVREVCIMKHLSNGVGVQTRRTSRTTPRNHYPTSIVCLHDVIEEEEFVHLVMELCHGGDLFDRIRKNKFYPESRAAFLMKGLLEALQFCHGMGIMHRDIKPENIIFVEESETSPIKLADFGLSLQFTPGQKFSGMAGSSYYMAPEVLKGEYSEEIDMWGAGVILYILLSGVPPFWGATEQRIFNAIQKGDLSFPASPWDEISASAKDMISQMLHPKAESRLTPAQALKHPWIVHHTRNAKHFQPNVPSSFRPSSAILAQHESAENSSSHRSSALSVLCEQTWAGAGNTHASEAELNKILADLVAGMNGHMFSIANSAAARTSQNGWTCSVLSVNANEERVVVEMGQEKYMVTHDRRRKRIGWKLLTDKTVSANLDCVRQCQSLC